MKHKVLRILTVCLCVAILASAFSGCQLLVDNVKVEYMKVDGVTVEYTDNINQFQKTFIHSSEEFVKGAKINGWSCDKDSDTADFISGRLLFYRDIKERIVDGAVRLYPVCKESAADIVVGWDSRVSLSGLTETIISKFEIMLRRMLQKNGYGDYTVEVRSYGDDDRDVMAAQILNDGDVDVLVGIGENIDTLMAVPVAEKKGGIRMGGISGGRYIARLNNFPTAMLVWDWLQTTEAQDSLSPGYYVEEEPEVAQKIVIVYEGRESISGLNEAKMENFKIELTEYLKLKGYDSPEIILRYYEPTEDGSNATPSIGAQIRQDGDVDVLVCVGENVDAAVGMGLGDLLVVPKSKPFTVNDKTKRYFAQLSDRKISALVFELLSDVNDDTARKWLEKEYVPPVIDNDLVIGWSAQTASTLTQEYADKFETALKAWLNANDYESVQVIMRKLGVNDDGSSMTALELGEQIRGYNDIDILIGVGENIDRPLDTGAGMTGGQKDGPFHMVTNGKRYLYRITETEMVLAVYDWIKSDECLEVFQVEDNDLVVGWNAQTASTLTQEYADKFETALKAWLNANDYESVQVIMRKLGVNDDGSSMTALELGEQIRGYNNIDILIGVNSVIDGETSKGGSGITGGQKNGPFHMAMNNKSYLYRITDTYMVHVVYDWIKSDDGIKALQAEDNDLVIGWSAMKTSTIDALNDGIMEVFKPALRKWLDDNGYENVTVTYVKLGENATTAKGILPEITQYQEQNGPIDILLGFGQNVNTTAGLGLSGGTISSQQTQGNSTTRYNYLMNNVSSKLVYDVFGWVNNASGGNQFLQTVAATSVSVANIVNSAYCPVTKEVF